MTPAQVALAWTLHHNGLIAITKAGTVEHVQKNWAAVALVLCGNDLAALDATFRLPQRRRRHETL